SDTSVYFSPHLDDVVLSCSANVLAERAAGRGVVVATLFSAGGEDAEGRHLYEQRRREDLRALALLDAQSLQVGLLDAPFRTPFYRSFRTIVLGEHLNDERHAAAIAAVVRAVCERLAPSRCYFPLGVGTHIDHRLVHRAAWCLPGSSAVFFYEDRPYAFLRHSVRLRLAELGAEVEADPLPPDLQPLEPDALVALFRQSLYELPFVRNYLQAGEEWHWCEAELIRRLTASLTATPSRDSLARLRPVLTEVQEDGRERVCAAVREYTSQVSVLFGTRA